MNRRLSTVLSVLLVLLLGTTTLHAEEGTKDLGQQFKDLKKAASKNKNGKDMDALRTALEGLVAIYEDEEADENLARAERIEPLLARQVAVAEVLGILHAHHLGLSGGEPDGGFVELREERPSHEQERSERGGQQSGGPE